MSAVHAAMDRLGAGMPCGLIARFENTSTAQVTEATLAAAGRFPTLALRVVWTNQRPMLEKATQVLPSQPTTIGSQNSEARIRMACRGNTPLLAMVMTPG